MGARETCSALKLKFKTDNNNLSNIYIKFEKVVYINF